jgi:hypothetical protein
MASLTDRESRTFFFPGQPILLHRRGGKTTKMLEVLRLFELNPSLERNTKREELCCPLCQQAYVSLNKEDCFICPQCLRCKESRL